MKAVQRQSETSRQLEQKAAEKTCKEDLNLEPDYEYIAPSEKIKVARYLIGEVGVEYMESTEPDGEVAVELMESTAPEGEVAKFIEAKGMPVFEMTAEREYREQSGLCFLLTLILSFSIIIKESVA